MAWFIFLEKHIYVHLDSTVSNEEVEWKTISEYGLIWNFIFACINLSLAAQVLYNECEMQPQILKTKDFLRQIKYYSHCGVSERSRKKLFLVNSIFPFNQTVFGKKKKYIYIYKWM